MHLEDGESTMNKKLAEVTELPHLGLAERGRGFHSLMSAIESSRIEVTDLSAASLSGVLSGVISGEGPTTNGRVHFSRALDREDALPCERSADTDIDSEILVWIASHVHSKKRLKSTLMGISAFLTGIGATLSIAAPSFTSVVDLIA